ncbi:tyrosine-type recombinase/integrase [Nocardia sp. NPDC058640]|uniref:tyrosine-type recombinase/integrase n=1 Tax=Nocardia sp. NPDC058640 TaxID=3346571 RepID=UPI003646034C
MPGRPPRPIGTFSTPSKPRRQPNGTWRTTVRYYGAWRITQIGRCGATPSEAANRLAEAMRDFRDISADAPVTRTTTLMELARQLLTAMRRDPDIGPGLVEDYRREIEVSHDRRAKPDTVKIENTIGRLQIWQATTGVLDRHLKEIVSHGHRRKAKQHKLVLRAMMQIAVRDDVLPINPISGVDKFRRTRPPARGKVVDMDALPAFRSQVSAWADGDEIPGTPGYVCGPARDRTMTWVVDVITGTGIRPQEVFALLIEEINLEAQTPFLDVTGTLVFEPGVGWIRKPTPKSENGWRRILLPEHTTEAIAEALRDLTVNRRPNPKGVLFPARNGSFRSPDNFGRIWRAARGDNFAWVTLRTFRRGVATAVDSATGDPERAARQLGNTVAVAKTHYIDRPETAPDNRDILEHWARGAPENP